MVLFADIIQNYIFLSGSAHHGFNHTDHATDWKDSVWLTTVRHSFLPLMNHRWRRQRRWLRRCRLQRIGTSKYYRCRQNQQNQELVECSVELNDQVWTLIARLRLQENTIKRLQESNLAPQVTPLQVATRPPTLATYSSKYSDKNSMRLWAFWWTKAAQFSIVDAERITSMTDCHLDGRFDTWFIHEEKSARISTTWLLEKRVVQRTHPMDRKVWGKDEFCCLATWTTRLVRQPHI